MYQYIAIALVVAIAVFLMVFRPTGRVHLDGHTLRLVALLIMLTGSGFFSLFIVGEIMTDPGGSTGVFYVILFLAPLLLLSVLAWVAPTISRYALAITTLGVIAFDIWTTIYFDTWRTFEDKNGPLVTIAIVVVEIPLAIHAFHRDTRITSFALMYLGLVPPILRATALGTFEFGSLQHLLTTTGFSPTLIVGAIYFWSTFRPERVTYPAAIHRT